MTVMITGGSGFVGLNIAQRLLSEGKNVVIFDRNGAPPSLGLALDDLPGHLVWVQGSVTDRQHLVDTITAHGVRQIVHGAAITAGAPRELTQAIEIAQVNLLGTIHVLEAALACDIERVVQLGTGSVYGTSVKSDGFLDEAQDIPVPDSLYGITKYAAERTAVRYRNTRGLHVTVARLGVVFGRYEYDTGVRDTLSAPLTLAIMAEKGQHAKVFAGLPDDWVYAGDVAIAVDQLLHSEGGKGSTGFSSAVYNVSAAGAWSVQDWCQKLCEAYPDFSFEMVQQQSEANVGRLTPSKRPPFSIERIHREVGYAPQYLLSAAFDDYLQWRRTLHE